MKVLFDHNVPYKLRTLLPHHDVSNAAQMGWAEIENGVLLRAAEDAGFDAMVTCDQNMFYQQNSKLRKLALIVLSTNDWNYLKLDSEPIVVAVERVEPGSFELVTIRRRPPSRRR